LNIHTWPEHGYAAIDLFTCGEEMDLEPGVEILKAAFEAEEVELTKILRGSKEKINQLHVR
ncbi:MAG: S-adenosylmethionine decarboxylase, partial [Bacteroidota bacterium]